MVISVSKRTDIPAFYSDWFFNRLKAGFVLVRNPMNFHQVSKIKLTSDLVDCIVFWTKNPSEMLSKHYDELKELKIPFYFQFTINPYDKSLEPNVPMKKEVFNTFIKLSKSIGKERVIWRYDPIIITDKLSLEYHYKYFEIMAKTLAPYTNKCVISFLDFYSKTKRNMRDIPLKNISSTDMLKLSQKLYDIASSYNLELVSCAESIELSQIGIPHSKCIDPELISQLCNGKVIATKDKNQRAECGCITSIDIGTYNTCPHGCLYCYANHSEKMVIAQVANHNPNSPLLFGELANDDIIKERKMVSIIDNQFNF